MLISDRVRRLLYGAIILLSLLFGILVLGDVVPALRGPEAWRWWLLPMPPLSKIALAGGALILTAAAWFFLGKKLVEQPARKRVWRSLMIFALLLFILQIAFLSISQTNPIAVLFERLVSNQASGYFTVAAEIDHLPTFLKEYPELMPQFRPDPHPRSKPPGIVLLYWGAAQIMEKIPAVAQPLGHWARGVRCADLWLAGQSDAALAGNVVVGLMTILTSLLVIWPAYGLAARRWGPGAGWLAAGLTALMPGRILFTPHLDTIYPFLTLLALYLADTGIRRGKVWWTAVSGFILSVATFFSLVNVLAAVLVGLFVLLHYLPKRDWQALLRQLAALVLGTLAIWGIYWLYGRVTPFDIYLAARPARHDLGRSYGLWLFGNLYDFAIFVGLPAFLTAVLLALSPQNKQKAFPLTLAFWGVLLLLDLSGIIRGETGRIWLMLAPLPPLLAAQSTNQPINQSTNQPANSFTIHYSLFILTAFSLLAMSLRWEVTHLEWPPAEARTIQTTLPDQPLLNIPFGSDIQLAAYDLQAGDHLALTLYWQVNDRPDTAYTVFIHVVDEVGNIPVQQDIMPQNGRLPTTCWQPQEIIIDDHELDISGLEPGTYQVVVGLYDQETAVRLGEVILEPAVDQRE